MFFFPSKISWTMEEGGRARSSSPRGLAMVLLGPQNSGSMTNLQHQLVQKKGPPIRVRVFSSNEEISSFFLWSLRVKCNII
ncbi:hypothetical protein Lalb_Chr15g0076931 [Lupinus albus]|uniref:Uncharacterized protein n=1 Tax=Lupinus albus TaxID=3870 RepID=A0A6A4PCN6_LUPAL|nr:hypothetical protein Lalb_Chr15g0076931 [Lupinus albus]